MEIPKIFQHLVPIFENHSSVKLAYLFGSRATGKVGSLSDYDFAVYLDEKNAKKRFDIHLQLLKDLSLALKRDDVDVVVLNDIDMPELKYFIVRDGVLLLERQPFKAILEPQILNDYFDFYDLLKRHHLTKA